MLRVRGDEVKFSGASYAQSCAYKPPIFLFFRGDQLTFVPPEDHAEPAPVLSPGVAVGEKNRARPPGGGSVLYGTFSAECVVRRASKVLEVLGALIDDDGLDSPAGIELVDTVRLRLVGWSRGEHGRSVPSATRHEPGGRVSRRRWP